MLLNSLTLITPRENDSWAIRQIWLLTEANGLNSEPTILVKGAPNSAPWSDQRLSVIGNASKSSGGTSWAVFSDERLKNIKGTFTPGLKTLLQLQPLRFEYKPNNALGLPSGAEELGFSAQEVEKVLPEAVTRTQQGYLQLHSDPILWTMLNAIKEQQQEIETLKAQNAALNARLRAIEKRPRNSIAVRHRAR